MLIFLDFWLYFPGYKSGEKQAGAERLAVACWSKKTPKKQILQRCASADRMAEPSVFYRSEEISKAEYY